MTLPAGDVQDERRPGYQDEILSVFSIKYKHVFNSYFLIWS